MAPNTTNQSSVRLPILWIAAMTLSGFLTGTLESTVLQFGATLVLSGIFAGLVGWVVLRSFGIADWRWFALTAVAWLAGTLVNTALTGPVIAIGEAIGTVIGGEVLYWPLLIDEMLWGLAMGIAQFVLLRHLYHSAVWWIPASIIGGLLNGIVGRALCAATCQMLPAWSVGIIEGAGWLAYAIVTGFVLAWLHSNRTPRTVTPALTTA